MPSPRLITSVLATPDTPHIVNCGTVIGNPNRLSACLLVVSYAPNPKVKLHGRIYFSDAPVDHPTFFADAAKWMIEVALCLDVTGQDDLSENPETDAGHCKINIMP